MAKNIIVQTHKTVWKDGEEVAIRPVQVRVLKPYSKRMFAYYPYDTKKNEEMELVKDKLGNPIPYKFL